MERDRVRSAHRDRTVIAVDQGGETRRAHRVGRELKPADALNGSAEPTLASIAVILGTTRLIDNVLLE